ncbi:MAG: hypothetical protein RLZZ273_1194 [Bacteroidota bacterium]|jgi:glutathione peroxidase
MKTLLFSLLALITMNTTFHDLSITTIDGAPQSLSAYKGKVVLVVNVASFCGYTKQYAPLEKLYEQYKDKGLVVLGFPANDFGAQEPGTNEEIKQFCSAKFGVSFPMAAKISVKGSDKAPVYEFLTSGGGNAALAGEIGWNFEKFLIGKDGKIITRYKSGVDPLAANVIADVEKALAQ